VYFLSELQLEVCVLEAGRVDGMTLLQALRHTAMQRCSTPPVRACYQLTFLGVVSFLTSQDAPAALAFFAFIMISH